VSRLILISIGEMEANRTFMLLVGEETPGLPFECAQLILGCVVFAAFIYWF
jgi:hypothetical protein